MITKSLTFWTLVADRMADGMLLGGLSALMGEAKQQYPGNEIFASFDDVPGRYPPRLIYHHAYPCD